MNEIIVQENDEMFEEIMKRCKINMDMSSWDYSSDNTIGYCYNARPLVCKKTNQQIGWLVNKEWSTEYGIHYTTHLTMKEDDLDELLKQDRW